MWAEPLTAAAVDRDPDTYDVIVRDAAGRRVAGLRIDVDLRRRAAFCRTLRILDPDGAPRQKLRALVLLLREALRHAQELGIQRGRADVTPAMLALASRLRGREIPQDGPLTIVTGEIADWRTTTLEETDGDGNLRDL